MTSIPHASNALPEHALTGRNVFVTGPAGRLVSAIAHAARERGARVVLATSNRSEDAEGRDCPDFSVDIVSEAAADELFERAAILIPGLDTVVVVETVQPLIAVHELSIDQWREIAVDRLRRVFWLIRRAVEGFLADAIDGRIVLVVDYAAPSGETNDVVASALRSLSRSFVREYGRRGLACNLVLSTCSHEDASATNDPFPVVEQVLFLASLAASFVNGESIVVRGLSP